MSASTDTFNLFAASFESGTSCTPMGWTMVDLTEQTGVYFHIDDYSGLEGFGLTPLDGAKSLWCGARPSASPVMCSYLTLPGYGNHWDQAWCTKNCIPVNGALDVSFVARFDTEPGHDFVTLEYTTDCSSEYGWTVIDEWSGSVPYLEHNASYDLGVGAGPVRVRLHFQSDGYGSDEDGLWQTTGAVHFDDLVVEGVPWENFEDEQVGSTSSNDWRAYAPDGYGSYLSLFSGGALVDEDPCTNNLSCVWAAIQNSTYNYACGGFPLQAAVPFVNPEGQYLKNEIWSPTIPLTGSGSAVLLEFSVYRDLPLDNLVFYVWHVRSVGAGGCPGPWKDRGTVYYSDTKDWYRHVERVGDLLDLGNATGMQVALGVWDMRDVWGGVYGTGFCHSQAPLFDSVQVKRVAVVGPQWSVKDIELFQDSFPGDGTASGTVRADMAKDINPSSNPAILPGDSAVVTVADPELGLMDDFVSGGKAVHCYVRVLHAGQPDKSGPDLVDDPRWSYVDDVAANGVAWSRIHCDQALVGGHPVQDRFCVDLNDNLFVPGDTVLYFFGAQNAYGEATYFAGSGAVDNIDVAAANALEFTCLPARALTAGARILYVNGAGDESSRLAIETALSQLGVLSEVDRYDVLGPSWDAGNRLASRVTSVYSQLLPFYDVILWECGDVPVTLGGGPGSSIKEDDYGLLAAFLESLDRPHGVCLSGDDVAEKLAMGSSSSSASFMSTYIPYTLTTGDHRTAYGVSPLVVGSPWGTFSNDTFYVSGGCPVLSDFDVMDPTGSSVMEAGYGSPATVNGAIIANWTSNGASVNVGVLLSGFRFDAVDNTGGGVYRTAYMDALLLSLNVSSLGGPAPPPPPSHNIIHVDANATGTGSGWSWQDAFTNLQTALAFAVPGNEIWVAEGIYRPAIGYDRTAAFHLKNGVKVYGGFAGTESALSERDLSLHASVLSGDIGVVGNNADNCYHVVSGSGNDATAVLDGFTVTEGNANGPSPDDSGGGIYITNGNPTIQNVIVIGNAAATRGGGIMCDGSSSFVNVLVRENIAPEGGGVAATSGTPVFTNATFTQNVAYGQGGAVYIDMSFPAFRNSILWDDLATVAGNEIYSATILPFSLEYSLVSPGGIAGSSIGTNNLSTDPQFVKPGVGDLRLRIGSPALNAGLNSVVSGVPTDLNSQPRIAEGTVDLGAYEGGVTVRVLYVDGDAAGNNDGTSWVDAYTNLQDAIAAAAGVGEIWVAEGVYYPTSGTDRNISFQLPPNFAIFGGFAGTETLLQQRDVSTHVTVLSGDIGIADEPLDNSFHVLSAALVDSNTVVDGFTVRDGCANGAGDQSGGGMFNDSSAPCLRNMVFQDNTALNGGGAMFNQNSRPKLVNIRFLDNTSSTDGGGIYNQTSSPTLVNVMFFQNSANGGGGGGVYNSASSPKLANVTFSGNQAAPLPSNSGGAAIHNVDSYPSLINCVLWGDVTSESTPEIYDDLDHPSSTVLSHSLVQGLGGCIGCVDQGENIDADPVFKNAAVGDLRLKNFGSPAVDAGTGTRLLMSVQTDLDGYPRVSSGGVDMGAFEVPCPTGSILYVDHDATGSEDGSSWANACVELSDAIRAAHCGGVNEIWVAAGTYRPTKNGDREATFSLVNGVSIYGGFAGGEVSLDQRSLLPDSTVLSGDIGTPGDSADNSFHVIDGSGTNATAVLDGFAVTAGAATGSPPNDSGGGMIVVAGSPTLRHLHFIGNQATDGGGAIYNSAASPALTDVRFTGNSANSGGAVYNFNGSAPRFVNAVFITNAAMVHGGALSSDASSPAVFNSQFIGNTAPTGGAVYGVGAAVATFVNTTFWSNAASDQGGAIFSRSSCNPVVTNDILWDNSAGNSGPELGNDTATPTISHCIVKGSNGSGASWDVALGSDGGGNQDANPMFINPVAGDFHVTQGSPAIDAGLNSAVPSDVVTDFDGHARILNGIVDLGPYEYFVQFTDVTAAAGLGGSSGLATGWGMAWGDYDNDGDMDLFYPGGGLYRNNGDGTFTNVGAPLAGQYALGAAWGDYDGDNDPDLYVGWPAGSILYRNDGGSFADVTASAGINVSGGWGGAWGDYDNDGDLDLYAVADTLTHLYRNQGDGTFIDEGSTSGIAAFPNSVGGVWGDFDLDGYLDLYVVAFDTGGRLYRNNGDGTFSDVTASVGISTCATGFSANWVDYDRDRDPDLHVASGCGATGRLFKNNLSSLFSDVTGSAGITAGTFAGWSDFDNDGDFDVGVGDWMVADAFRLFRNNGSGTFTDVTTTAHATGSGAQLGWADYDNDGDFDLYVLGGVGAAPGPNRLLRNNQVYSSGHHWLHVRLVGVWSNRSGIGARVRCVVGKNAETCEISGGNGLSQNSLIAAFGLGSATVADTLEVFWPRGAHQVLTHQLGDREITVTELAPTGVATDDHLPKEYALYENFPNPFNPTTTIRFDLPAPGKVQLDIFDVTGRLVKRLIRDVPYSRGRFEVHWNGENESGNTVASGVYFYRIRSGTYSAARRMVLLK